MFVVLLKTHEAEWRWVLDTDEADALWRYLGQPTSTDIRSVAAAHGRLTGES